MTTRQNKPFTEYTSEDWVAFHRHASTQVEGQDAKDLHLRQAAEYQVQATQTEGSTQP